MNIFVLDHDPAKAAAMLCDCHVRKMCLETAQILSGVMLRRGLELYESMPKAQNVNHPVIIAADADNDALDWVINYNYDLLQQFSNRFDKPHAYNKMAMDYISELWSGSYPGDCTNLAKCCGDLDVADMDIVTAYRKYYTEVKKPTLMAKNMWKFTNREDWTE